MLWKIVCALAIATRAAAAEGALQGNQAHQQQHQQRWSTAVAAAPPAPPSLAKNAKISAHLLGGEPLPQQPKAPTPSSCPGGCAANGDCDAEASIALVLAPAVDKHK